MFRYEKNKWDTSLQHMKLEDLRQSFLNDTAHTFTTASSKNLVHYVTFAESLWTIPDPVWTVHWNAQYYRYLSLDTDNYSLVTQV